MERNIDVFSSLLQPTFPFIPIKFFFRGSDKHDIGEGNSDINKRN